MSTVSTVSTWKNNPRTNAESAYASTEPFPGDLPQLRVEAPAPASFTVAQPMRTASGMASAREEGARAASREPATRNHKLGK